MIIAITGASGVGKTTITKELSKTLPDNVRVFHFDDIGMPDWSKVDAKKWQEETTHQWVDKIVQVTREENVDVLFEGSTDIQFYIDAFAKNNFSDYHLLLFDCETATMEKRLTERGQPELYHKDMVNWLKYLRQLAQQKNIEIIRTDHYSIQEISQILIDKLEANK